MKKALSILLLFVFFLAQYGKIVSYMYCRWQIEIKTANCDCEKKLGTDTKNNPDQTPQLPQTAKAEQPCVAAYFIGFNYHFQQINSCFVNSTPSLTKGFEYPLLHPPAIA